jgi:esterase
MDPILSHQRVTGKPDPAKWMYVIHGIYGAGRNWGSVARRLVEEQPEWGVILVDLRIHGGSLGFTSPHTVAACAADVARLEEHLGLPARVLLGHSFGGKVALLRAARGSSGVSQVWVIDSSLQTGPPGGSPWEMISIVRSLPETFESRDEIEAALLERGQDPGVGHWLATNLERHEGKLRWKLDWDAAELMLRDYFATDVLGMVDNPPGEVEIHVVKAVESSAVNPEVVNRLEAAGEKNGRVHLYTIAGGHWLNVQNPDGVLELLKNHLH